MSTDPRALVEQIDRVLDDCDAAQLPPLPTNPPCADPTSWPEPRLVEGQALIEASPARRSWLVRWLPRRARP